MSRTKSVTYQDRGFWASDVVLGVFLKYLIDAVEASGHSHSRFITDALASWRLALIYDFVVAFGESWTPLQRLTVTTFAEEACARLATRESISTEEIAGWPLTGQERVFNRGLKAVRTAAVIELGRAIIALLRNELPEPPKGEAWLFTDTGRSTLQMNPLWNGRWGSGATLGKAIDRA